MQTGLTVEARHVLIGMKARLSKGWVKGVLFDLLTDGVCLYGALINVGGGCGVRHGSGRGEGVAGRDAGPNADLQVHVDLNSSAGIAIRVLAEEAGVTVTNLALWQDAPERTHEEIIDLIDRALARQDERRRSFWGRRARLDDTTQLARTE